MAETFVILTIFDKVLNVLGLIRERQIVRDEKIDSALHALYAALSQRQNYISLN
jgi:hypothetical protein